MYFFFFLKKWLLSTKISDIHFGSDHFVHIYCEIGEKKCLYDTIAFDKMLFSVQK